MNATTTGTEASRTPTVTIVTPSYNQGHFIRATIESVLSQDYRHLDYIVMDGGSTDQTAAVVREYASRLKWRSEKDRGQSHAINKGFAMASGDIVAWLNSDDILLPGAIAAAVKAFGDAPQQVGAIYGEGYLMDRAGRVTGRFPATEPFNLWKLVYLSDYILQQSAFFRRKAVAEVGGLDESLHYTMDWDLLIQLGKRFGLYYIPEYLGVLREYPEAKTFAGGKARIEEIRRLLERHTGFKRAPGYWTYGMEMFRTQWKNYAGRASLRLPAGVAAFFARHATAIPLMLIHRHCQGLYPDRWASDRLRWMLPERARSAVVRGDSTISNQTLSITAAGREIGAWKIWPGAFTLRFDIPPTGIGPFEFEIRASRYKRPPIGSELSFRRMAWKVESIEWTEEAIAPPHDTMHRSIPP